MDELLTYCQDNPGTLLGYLLTGLLASWRGGRWALGKLLPPHGELALALVKAIREASDEIVDFNDSWVYTKDGPDGRDFVEVSRTDSRILIRSVDVRGSLRWGEARAVRIAAEARRKALITSRVAAKTKELKESLNKALTSGT